MISCCMGIDSSIPIHNNMICRCEINVFRYEQSVYLGISDIIFQPY